MCRTCSSSVLSCCNSNNNTHFVIWPFQLHCSISRYGSNIVSLNNSVHSSPSDAFIWFSKSYVYIAPNCKDEMKFIWSCISNPTKEERCMKKHYALTKGGAIETTINWHDSLYSVTLCLIQFQWIIVTMNHIIIWIIVKVYHLVWYMYCGNNIQQP